MQPFFENVSKKNQNFKKIKIEVLVSRSVFKLEKKTKKIREAEEKLTKNILPGFLKPVEFLNTLFLSCRKFMKGALNTDIGRGGSVCHRSCYIDRGLQILDRRPWIIHTFGKASLSLQHYDHYQATVRERKKGSIAVRAQSTL